MLITNMTLLRPLEQTAELRYCMSDEIGMFLTTIYMWFSFTNTIPIFLNIEPAVKKHETLQLTYHQGFIS